MLKSTRALVRRTAGAVLPVALVAAAIACLRYAPDDNVADHANKDAGRLERPEAGPQNPAPSTPTTSPRTATGPGVTSPGIRLVAKPNTDGTFEVSESVVFRSPRSTVNLAAPSAKSGGPTFVRKAPRADMVQLSAQGQPALAGAVNVYAKPVKLRMATNRIELRYVLAGATVRSIPSVAGRALGLLAPLAATTDRTLPVRIEVVGPSVRNLICPRRPPNVRQCAGTGANLGVAPLMSAALAVVIVQYDLPKPS